MTSAAHPDAPAPAAPAASAGPAFTLQRALPIIDAAGIVGIPVILRGGSGIGKTSGLTTLAQARDEHLEVVTASLYEPTDFGGLPVVADGQVNLAPMPWVRRVVNADKTVRVLFDELNTAPQPTQAALLRLLLDRVSGDTVLPSTVRFCAAINPVESSTGGWELPSPIAARFLHLDVGADADEWVEGMLSGWNTTPGRVTCLDPDGPGVADRAAAALAQVTAFINAHPEWLDVEPSDPTLAAGAWPSPRKWDWVAQILPLIPNEGDLVVKAVEGLVGRGAAAAFLTYADELALPDPSTVLADPDSVDWAGEPAERVQAVVSSLLPLAGSDADSYAQAGVVLKAVVAAGRADVAATVAKVYLTSAPAGAVRDTDLLSSFAPLLVRAGKVR